MKLYEKLYQWSNTLDEIEQEAKVIFNQVRTNHKMTQVDFAKILGVTVTHISNIERGAQVPSNFLIKKLAIWCLKNEYKS